jgi:hypothetical protein
MSQFLSISGHGGRKKVFLRDSGAGNESFNEFSLLRLVAGVWRAMRRGGIRNCDRPDVPSLSGC